MRRSCLSVRTPLSRSWIVLAVAAGFLNCILFATADAQEAPAGTNADPPSGSDDNVHRGLLSDDPEDPENLLPQIRQRQAQKTSLFRLSVLGHLYETTDQAQEDLYEATHLKLGLAFTHLFQWLSEAPLSGDTWGTASDLDLLGTWELVDRGGPTQGQLFFHFEGRWEYGTTGPERLGTVGLGSLIGTANTFSAYVPTFLLRNLYWQQGSADAGWAFRTGKITPDAILATSAHIAAPLTFITTAGGGPFAIALPDSGLGIAGAWYINDRLKLMGVFSDANADRFNFGDIGAGDFFTAVELAVKIAPRTPKAGYSKLVLWHTDGTKDGEAANGNLGPDGWGFFLKHEQELTADGRKILVLKYGRSSNESAFYEQQAGAFFLLYDPTGLSRLQNDLLGVAFNWAQAAVSGARAESNVEVFYRFALLPQLDMTLDYQLVINPALDPDNDSASVFSIRLRTTL